jgi:hypothetical protein
MVVSPLVEFHCRLHPLPTRSSPARRLIGWRVATHETRFSTTPSHRSGLRSFLVSQVILTTTPSADFCHVVRAPYDALSHISVTQGRSPGRSPAIRLTAFNAQPPNLPPAPLRDVDFAVIGQLVRHRSLISGSCPSARVFAPRFLQTSPRDDALALRYHFSSIRM